MRPSSTFFALVLVTGCSAEAGLASPRPPAGGAAPPSDETADGDVGEPEQEASFLLRPPAQTDVYVFVANPERDTLTRVRVADLRVDTTPVGRRPEIVVTTPDYTTAVVFNAGDDTVTLVDADTLDQRTVPVRNRLNDLALSPDGGHAVLWHNTAKDDGAEAPGLQSFNEASFVDVATGEHYPMAVGFNPRMVRFTPDSALAVVVADAYLATVDLTADALAPRLIELEPDRLDVPPAEEVLVADDGSFAWVRQFGASELLVVDLVTGAVDRVPTGDNPTDLDLSHDGQQAIAVARNARRLVVYDAADPFAPPTEVELPASGAPYGSLLVDPKGELGILYTTAALESRFAVWDRATNEIRERSLVKPVRSMAIDPTGQSLLVFHTREDGVDSEERFLGAHALTMIRLSDLGANPLLLPGEITGYANGTDGTWGFFVMGDEPFLEVLDYGRLLHQEYALRSVPTFLGVLPDLTPGDGDSPPAWVSQEHPLGRLSFYDPDDASLETLTGFELNSEIEEE